MNRNQFDSALTDREREESYADAGIPNDWTTFHRQESWLDKAVRLGYLPDEHARF